MSTDDINEALHRFHNFDDAILEGIAVAFPDRQKFGIGDIALLARESTGVHPGDWFNVNLHIEGIAEFRFTENPRCSNRVLSSGLKVQPIDNLIWIFFDQDDAALSADEGRHSQFYICGSKFQVRVRPIALP